jgi:hypothetical protein
VLLGCFVVCTFVAESEVEIDLKVEWQIASVFGVASQDRVVT